MYSFMCYFSTRAHSWPWHITAHRWPSQRKQKHCGQDNQTIIEMEMKCKKWMVHELDCTWTLRDRSTTHTHTTHTYKHTHTQNTHTNTLSLSHTHTHIINRTHPHLFFPLFFSVCPVSGHLLFYSRGSTFRNPTSLEVGIRNTSKDH